MKILITGADSFIGKNLKAELINRQNAEISEINDFTDKELLEKYIEESDCIFHLQTLYRSADAAAFDTVNTGTTRTVVDLIGQRRKMLVMLSSTQAETGSPYGVSKLKAENIIIEWRNNTGNAASIFRLANEFGKWCPPNLNSVVATFCDNIANNREIQVNDPGAPLKLMYIDDIISALIKATGEENTPVFGEIKPVYETTVGRLAEILKAFHSNRENNNLPNLGNDLIKKLYSTYLSCLPADSFASPLDTHADDRGSFTEMLHFGGLGQVSVNISKPGVTKGNHWHNTKTEKFIVIKGSGAIHLRKIGESEVIVYPVGGDKIEVLDIPPGYTHNITNTGKTDMITVMWANENFDKEKPDTYFEEV